MKVKRSDSWKKAHRERLLKKHFGVAQNDRHFEEKLMEQKTL
jgi:hypothetical protein